MRGVNYSGSAKQQVNRDDDEDENNDAEEDGVQCPGGAPAPGLECVGEKHPGKG